MERFRTHSDHARVLAKLTRLCALPPEDQDTLADTPVIFREVQADEDIVSQGDRPNACTAILTGFACRYRLAPDGRRQILSFHVPGDMPDLQSLHIEVMDHGMTALRPTIVALLPHSRLRPLLLDRPALELALWRETVLDAAVYRQWIFGLGRRTAEERLAHTLCETAERFRLAGLPRESVALPLRQTQLADALGLSPVHVNRVLQELRGRGWIGAERSAIGIRDGAALAAFAHFDPAYLTVAGASRDRTGRRT